jgi:hypothetical protein
MNDDVTDDITASFEQLQSELMSFAASIASVERLAPIIAALASSTNPVGYRRNCSIELCSAACVRVVRVIAH